LSDQKEREREIKRRSLAEEMVRKLIRALAIIMARYIHFDSNQNGGGR